MSKKQFPKDHLRLYLESHANLADYYVLENSTRDGALICFVTADGQAWVLMDDGDDLVEACVDYLKICNVPFFDDVDAMNEYEVKIIKKYIKS